MGAAIDKRTVRKFQLRPFYGAGSALPADYAHTDMGREETCQSIIGKQNNLPNSKGATLNSTSQGVAGWTKYTGGLTTWSLK
jgi:hypothetical protein